MKKITFIVAFLLLGIGFAGAQTHLERYNMSINAEFQKRVSASITDAAFSVLGEDTLTYSPAVVAKRHELAMNVLSHPVTYQYRFALYVASEAFWTTTITDSDINFTVSAVWNDVAGVRWDD